MKNALNRENINPKKLWFLYSKPPWIKKHFYIQPKQAMRSKFKIFQFNVISSALSPNPIECNTTMFPPWLSNVCKKSLYKLKRGWSSISKGLPFLSDYIWLKHLKVLSHQVKGDNYSHGSWLYIVFRYQ